MTKTAMRETYRIALIPGDGIGREVVPEGVRAVEAGGRRHGVGFEWTELIVCTDDGSAGLKGLVTEGIKQSVAKHADIDEVVAIGPPIMMKGCAETTRPHGIRTRQPQPH